MREMQRRNLEADSPRVTPRSSFGPALCPLE
jgi:hypothetical protein